MYLLTKTIKFCVFMIILDYSRKINGDERPCDTVHHVKCVGLPIYASIVTNETVCVEECFDNLQCEFYTYDESNFVCTLFEVCPAPEYCESCVTGHCPFPTTVTTVASTTIDPKVFKRIMVVGGANQNGFLSDVEYLDPFDVNVACSKPPDFPYARDGMVGEFFGGKSYICGGWNGDEDLDECFRLEDQKWNQYSSLLYPRGFTSDILLETGDEHSTDSWWLTGGFTAANATEILYDYNSHFVQGTSLPEDMHYHCMGSINNSHIFIAGSNYGSGHQAYIVDTTNHQNFVFSKLPDLNHRHYGAACFRALLDEELQLVVAGGRTSDRMSERFSFSRNQWLEGAELPRDFFSGGYVTYPDTRGTILIGGIDKNDAYHNDILWFRESGQGEFQFLPVKLDIGRWNFGVLLTQYEEEC